MEDNWYERVDLYGKTVLAIVQSDEYVLHAGETFTFEWEAPEWLEREIVVSGIIVTHSPNPNGNKSIEGKVMSHVKNQNIAIAVGAVAVTAVASRFVWKRFRNRKAK